MRKIGSYIDFLAYVALVGFACLGMYHVIGARVAHSAYVTPIEALPTVNRHGGDVHVVMDDGTLIVIPDTGCVVIVRADETDGTCLES